MNATTRRAMAALFAVACSGCVHARATEKAAPKSPHAAARSERGVTQGQPIARDAPASRPPVAVVRRAAFQTNVLRAARKNDASRALVFTGGEAELGLRTIPRGGDIGVESHANVEEIVFVASGRGKAIVDGAETPLEPGDVLVVEPGARHDIVNTGAEPLLLYEVIAPPLPDGEALHTNAASARSRQARAR